MRGEGEAELPADGGGRLYIAYLHKVKISQGAQSRATKGLISGVCSDRGRAGRGGSDWGPGERKGGELGPSAVKSSRAQPCRWGRALHSWGQLRGRQEGPMGACGPSSPQTTALRVSGRPRTSIS